jgi:hypothetical protein
MGRAGSALDNAMAESFVSTLKCELVHGHRFPTREAARVAIFEYLETSYNTRRLHSALGYKSPADFEEDRIGVANVDLSVLAGESHTAVEPRWPSDRPLAVRCRVGAVRLLLCHPACAAKTCAETPPLRGSISSVFLRGIAWRWDLGYGASVASIRNGNVSLPKEG